VGNGDQLAGGLDPDAIGCAVNGALFQRLFLGRFQVVERRALVSEVDQVVHLVDGGAISAIAAVSVVRLS